MKQTNLANIAISGLLLFTGCAFGTPHNEGKEMEAKFISPPNEYRPQPFWHINGELTKEGIYRQITDAYQKGWFWRCGSIVINSCQDVGRQGNLPRNDSRIFE